MGGSRPSTRALHSRPHLRREHHRLMLSRQGAGVLARGVGLRGFESHPPHQERYPLQGKVLEHAFWLKKEGYRESTIVSRVKLLAGLAKKANLLEPESVKEAVARLDVSEARKENIVCVYGSFCRQNSLPFNPPRYHSVERLHFMPSD